MSLKYSHRFAEIDTEILRLIDQGVNQYFRFCATPSVVRLAKSLAKDGKEGEEGYDRVIDRRLQALRKRGHIEFAKGRWKISTPR